MFLKRRDGTFQSVRYAKCTGFEIAHRPFDVRSKKTRTIFGIDILQLKRLVVVNAEFATDHRTHKDLGDHLTRVAIWISDQFERRVYADKFSDFNLETCFLQHFSFHRILSSFADIHRSAGKTPRIFFLSLTSTLEQNVTFLIGNDSRSSVQKDRLMPDQSAKPLYIPSHRNTL